MSTLEIWYVLDGISEACSMKFYFYIWNLAWINIWRIEETTKYCEKLGDLLLLLLLFVYSHFMGSWAALRWFCMRIWIFTVLTVSYLQLQTFLKFFLCIYTYSTSLLCVAFVNFSEVLSSVCYSTCFHTVSLYPFVFRTLPSCLLLLTNRRSPDVLLAHCLAGSALSTPYHRRFTNLFITIFFILLSILCFVLFWIGIFVFTNTVHTKVAKTAKGELRFCFFVILLFLLPHLVSIRNEDLQTIPDRIHSNKRPWYVGYYHTWWSYISTRLWLQADNHQTVVWCNLLPVLICWTSTRG